MTSCYHCHEPIVGESFKLASHPVSKLKRPNDLHTAELEFCCIGCRAVFQSIIKYDCGQYYDYRTEIADKPSEYQQDNYHWADELIDQLDFVEKTETDGKNAYQASLLIEGMRCSACAWLIESSLAKYKGVSQVSVQLVNQKLTIRWDQTTVKLSEIFQHLTNLGYSPTGWSMQKQWECYHNKKSGILKYLGVSGIVMMQVGMLSIGLYAGEWQNSMAESTVQLLRLACFMLVSFALYYCGKPFYKSAVGGLRNRVINMDIPVTLALSIAYCYSLMAIVIQAEHVYFDTIAMFLFFLWLSRFIEYQSRGEFHLTTHEFLPSLVRCKVRESASFLNEMWITQPEKTLLRSKLQPGDQLLCKQGDALAADGVLLSAFARVDRSTFTGESEAIPISKGEIINAGVINVGDPFWVSVCSEYGSSSFDRLNTLANQVQGDKPKYQQLIDYVSPYFTLAVLTIAFIVVGYWLVVDSSKAITACMAVLIVSCPCALSLATPLAMAIANRCAGSLGVSVLGKDAWTKLAGVDDIVFDKTGTLTEALDIHSEFYIHESSVLEKSVEKEEVLQIAASLESLSSHPIAQSFLQKNCLALKKVSDFTVYDGAGIQGAVDGVCYRLGKPKWCLELHDHNQYRAKALSNSDILLVSERGIVAGFTLSEQLKPDALSTVKYLTDNGYKVHLVSGDNKQKVTAIADQLGIDSFAYAQSPEEKLSFLKQRQDSGAKVLCVGDGVNDAPLIAAADISMAVSNASTLTSAKADLLLCRSSLFEINDVLGLAKITRSTIVENCMWALIYNVLAIALAATALLPPYVAAIGMTLSSLVVLCHSRRIQRRYQSVCNRKYFGVMGQLKIIVEKLFVTAKLLKKEPAID